MRKRRTFDDKISFSLKPLLVLNTPSFVVTEFIWHFSFRPFLQQVASHTE